MSDDKDELFFAVPHFVKVRINKIGNFRETEILDF
jgi:hypothetical protein